jgi:hypothetical protein
MNTTTLRTLTATLPNGETITRTTKAAYKFVAVALNPYTNEWKVQGWSAKPIAAKSVSFFDHTFPLDCFSRASRNEWGKTERKVQTVTIAVNA